MTWFEQRHRDPQRQHGFDLFGRTLRRRRLWLGWTQRQLEAYSGIDQAVICRLENGKQYGLRWARLADLIDALGGLEVGPGASDPPGYARGASARRASTSQAASTPRTMTTIYPRPAPDAAYRHQERCGEEAALNQAYGATRTARVTGPTAGRRVPYQAVVVAASVMPSDSSQRSASM